MTEWLLSASTKKLVLGVQLEIREEDNCVFRAVCSHRPCGLKKQQLISIPNRCGRQRVHVTVEQQAGGVNTATGVIAQGLPANVLLGSPTPKQGTEFFGLVLV